MRRRINKIAKAQQAKLERNNRSRQGSTSDKGIANLFVIILEH